MISVTSRDGNESGLEMDEIELEEGESLCDNNDGGDSTIDPDVALSYIEEKLHSVLGHFQKDFEGSVSVENLGAKFGAYGSFLPTYQRSPPSWPSTRSPLEAHNSNSPSSPRKIYPEDRKVNSIASSTVCPSSRSRSATGKALSGGSSYRGNGNPPSGLSSTCAEESSSKRGVIKKATNSLDQKTLKVRIRVGSENLLRQKNADIYSGLGLEISPSTSLEDSPTTSTGFCNKVLQGREESPISILQVMTSFSGDPLLSPLSESLIRLTVNKRLPEISESKLIENSGILSNGSHSRGIHKPMEQKLSKSHESSDAFTTKFLNQNQSCDEDVNVTLLNNIEKESDIDTLSCEKLISDTLKLPLLSGCQYNDTGPGKRTPGLNDEVEGETLSTVEYVNNPSDQDHGKAKNSGLKLGSTSKVTESKKVTGGSNIAASALKLVPKAEKYPVFEPSESDISKRRKALDSESSAEPSKHFVVKEEKSTNVEDNERCLDKLSTGPKRKQIEMHSPGSQILDRPKCQSMAVSSASHMHGKKPGANFLVSKNDFHDLPKGQKKPVCQYKDFCGDVDFENDDNGSISGEAISMGRFNDPQLVEKRSSTESHSTSKEKHGAKIPEIPCTSEKNPKVTVDLVPALEHRHSSQAPLTNAPLGNEDWVFCNKCRKWRLLPFDTNPKSLPDKWLCRMLTWLPGMNRCNVPEVETTNALRALYYPTASVTGTNCESQQVQLNNVASGDQETHTNNVQVAHITKKKKHGPTKAVNLVDLDGKTNNSHSLKSSLVNQSNKGTTTNGSIKHESEMEDFKPSKRIRTMDLHADDLNWASNNGGTSSNVGHHSTSLPEDVLGYTQHKNKTDFTNNAKDIFLSKDAERHNPGTENDRSRSRRTDDDKSLRKRKSEQANGFRLHQEPISSFGLHNQESGDVGRQSHDEHRIETKAKVSEQMKDETGSKISGGANKSISTKEQSFVAATSSSSKVSESQKDKNIDYEVKDSPVESVSSSPLRFSTSKNVIGLNLSRKENLHGPGSLTAGEEGGSGGKEIEEKETNIIRDIDKDILSHINQYADAKLSSIKWKDDKQTSTEQTRDFASCSTKYKGQPSHSKDKLSMKSQMDIKVHEDKNYLPPDSEGGKLPKKTDPDEVCGRDKSNSLLPSLDRGPNENASSFNPIFGSQRETGDVLDNDDAQKVPIQEKKSEKHNGQPTTTSRNSIPNMHKRQGAEAPNPLQRDSSSRSANTSLKEAKDLKHLADRLKNSGSAEVIGLYFQAALKFLLGASLLESGSSEAIKHNERMHSMHLYSSTAKLCEFCAHEYEKSKDMASAALAYKCVEVAYMRVVYSSNTNSIRDRNELQKALPIVLPGELSTSSASDIYNLNNQGSTEKAAIAKVVGSPQVSGSHTFTLRSRAGFSRILDFAQNVNSAMEASRKSRIAFSRLRDTPHNEGITSLKNALDFNFHDVEGLLRLVRVAMEAIAR